MISLILLAVFAVCTTVLCLLPHGLETFSIASEKPANSHAGYVLWICGIFCSCCHFCFTTSLMLKWRKYNRQNPFEPITDPSDECIGIVLLFIDWYHLFRRRYPPKDEVDIQDLQVLSLGWFLIIHS